MRSEESTEGEMLPNEFAGRSIDIAEQDGDPTESGLTAGGTGTNVSRGSEVGGPGGSGGGVVDRVGGVGTVGGTSSGDLWSGTGIPGKPTEPEKER